MTGNAPAGAAPTVASALTETAAALAAAGIGAPRREARVLLGIALSLEPLALLTAPERPVLDAEMSALAAALSRRLAGEPPSRIRGSREFWSLDFAIAPGVLDPRPDTERLVECALAHVQTRRGEPLRILDLGAGSGCILLSLLHELPAAFGVGIDRSPAAVAVARSNARRLGLSGRSTWICGDWAAPLGGGFDLIVANPPYIPAGQIATLDRGVRAFDPAPALDGGPDGLAAYRRLIPAMPELLADSGAVFLEVGVGQAPRVAALAAAAGLRSRIALDLAGIPRVVGMFAEFSACNAHNGS